MLSLCMHIPQSVRPSASFFGLWLLCITRFVLSGVGGIVFNSKRQVLVIVEKYFFAKKIWKMPGGLVDPKENLNEAVEREVREETGIDAQFMSVVGIV